MKIAIIGCGLIGRKRARAISSLDHQIIACSDSVRERAESLAGDYGAPGCFVGDVGPLFSHANPDIAICATPHNSLAPLAAIAATSGAHIFLEKPGARYVSELEAIRTVADKNKVMVRVGYNLRYHPAMQQAMSSLRSGSIGKLRFFRGKYGHGGRIGYEREWRCSKEISGGGVAIDIASHLIDLVAWFGGSPLHLDYGKVTKEFWRAPVEDNAVLRVYNDVGNWGVIQASWTEWKNTFQFEIVGTNGKIEINGIGGSYGVERLSLYVMRGEMGPPDTLIHEWPQSDNSWRDELGEFVTDVRLHRPPNCGIDDAINVLHVIESLYSSNDLA